MEGRAGENAAFQGLPLQSVIGRGVDIVPLHRDGTHQSALKIKFLLEGMHRRMR